MDAQQYRQVVPRLLDLSETPRPHDTEQLHGYRDPEIPGRKGYRLDQGAYRRRYTVDDNTRRVITFRVGHRKDIHR